jgi:hypothetical protein
MLTYQYLENNPKASPFRRRGFPLHDDIAAIVDGVMATGCNVFSVGRVIDLAEGSEGNLTEPTESQANDGGSEKESERGDGDDRVSEPEEVSNHHGWVSSILTKHKAWHSPNTVACYHQNPSTSCFYQAKTS